MPLHLKCPLCEQTAVFPDAAIHRRVECGFCHATHHVRDIAHRHEPPAAPNAPPGQGMSRSEPAEIRSQLRDMEYCGNHERCSDRATYFGSDIAAEE